MAKPPAPRPQAKLPDKPPAKPSSFEADFERALTGNKKTARGRMTEVLRKLAEQDPASFARGLKRLINGGE